MALTNEQHNEVSYCEFQISWRKQTLIELEAQLKTINQNLSKNFHLYEPELFECTQKIGKIKRKIESFENRLGELRSNRA